MKQSNKTNVKCPPWRICPLAYKTLNLKFRTLNSQFIFYFLFFIFYFLFTLSSYSQPSKPVYSTHSKKAIKHYETALQHYNAFDYWNCENELFKAIIADSTFVEALILLGDVYDFNRKPDKAVRYYKKAIAASPDFFPGTYFILAQNEFTVGKYEDAKSHYEKFLSYPDIPQKQKKQAEINIKNCAFSIEAIKRPVPFNPVNMGDSVNSPYDEYLPAITADEQTLIFTVRHPADEETYYPHDGTEEDFFICHRNGDHWTKAKELGSPINTPGNEGAQCISPDGQILIFTACNRTDGKGSCDLYFAKKNGDNWSRPVNLGPPINTSAWESQPSLSSDGKTLYFVSNRKGGHGEKDIWKSELGDDGYWGNPVNLGDSINTEGMEQSPCIHPDNRTLYFSSDGHTGMGGEDIFYSRKNEKGEWKIPVNIGYPINTYGDESSLFVSADGKTAYFAAKKEKNGFDICSFDLPPEVRPHPVSYLKGKVMNRKTMAPLEAKFELIDLAENLTAVQSWSNKGNGEFLVCLPPGKKYALNVSKKGFLFYSEHFEMPDTASASRPYSTDIMLNPVAIGEKVILKNIFYETDKYDLKPESKAELDKLMAFMNDNPTVKIEISGHTDDVGDTKYNLTLSGNRAKTVYDYLVQNHLAPERLSYQGYGDTQPEFPNDSDDNRAKNRRTEFKVIAL